ncbi:response regulator [candidate division KSB3 bacterium]|uniref:histidine kinase n=1 Tax=candidate division KSB3 bacterium TaxID=2044937 RepID=A0A9D5JZE2_9BACT|nr:response regulator [candidate division KSB3 bacterium]MBD3326840.1 response regulator [candidate division KSB3 bacterium]
MEKRFILCVDDQPEVVGSLLTQLEHGFGHICEIEAAESADEALEVFQELRATDKQVEIVITDEVMPGMPGSRLLEIIHQLDPNVMTVMLTGQAGFDDVLYAVNHAELTRCIKKPWQYDDLKATVLDLLEKARLNREYQHLEQQVVEEKNKAEAIVHSISDGIIVFEGDDRISLVNQACTEILRQSETDLIGKRIMDVVALKEFIELLMEASRQSDTVMSNELVLEHPKYAHQEMHLIATARTLRDKQGVPLGVVMVLRDVTQEKELRQMKANFLSTMSHELRTPLTSIIGTHELLLQGSLGHLTPEQREFITLSHQQGEILAELIQNLIDLANLEGHRLECLPGPVNLPQLVHDTALPFQDLANAKGLQLSITIEPDLPLLLGDERKLKQMLNTLLSNALKFTEQGTIHITVTRTDAMLQLSVADTGIGIRQEHLDKIFDTFFQVDDSSTREFRGSGLGLAICQAIVHAHNGQIWAESELGKGTTVHVTLPLTQDIQKHTMNTVAPGKQPL